MSSPPLVSRDTNDPHEREPRPEGRVVLVEDDDAMRKIVWRVLVDVGFEAYVAEDGVDALAQIDALVAAGTPPDVVVSDVLMPRLGGRELAEHLEQQLPKVPVILMSGQTDVSEVRTGLTNVPFPVLRKPFNMTQFIQRVADAIALRSGGGDGKRKE